MALKNLVNVSEKCLNTRRIITNYGYTNAKHPVFFLWYGRKSFILVLIY